MKLCQNLTYEEIIKLYEGFDRVTSCKFYTKQQIQHLKEFHNFRFRDEPNDNQSSWGWHNHVATLSLSAGIEDLFTKVFSNYEGNNLNSYMRFIDEHIKPAISNT